MCYDNVMAVIPCREDSKRFPGKNTALFQGVPLVKNTIRIAKAAGIENIIVTSNSDDVLDIALTEMAEGLGLLPRDEHLCTDDARMEDVVEDVVSAFEFDTICLMQVTSPLLRPDSLQIALGTYFDTEATSLTAVNHHYEPCGAFYIVDRERFMNNKSFYQEGGGVYILPEDQCIDVDRPHQLQIAKLVGAGRVA